MLTRYHPVLPAMHTFGNGMSGMNHTCIYSPATQHDRSLAGTHFLSRWGQKAELALVVGYKPRWFTRPQMVTHLSTNRARHRVTSLIEINELLLSQAGASFYDDWMVTVNSKVPRIMEQLPFQPRISNVCAKSICAPSYTAMTAFTSHSSTSVFLSAI